MSHLNDTHLASQTIFLNSEDAALDHEDGYKTFFLQQYIHVPRNMDIYIGVSNFNCPATCYNINSTNNVLAIETDTYGEMLFEIDPAQYSASSLTTYINTLLTENAAALNATITATFSTTTYKFTFSSTDNDFCITDNTTLATVLGLYGQLPTVYTTVYTASNICNFAGITSYNIMIPNLSFNNLDSAGKEISTLAKINVDVKFGSFIYYQPSEILYARLRTQSIKRLDVKLMDYTNTNVLELNGAQWSVALTLHFGYSRDRILTVDYPKVQPPDENNATQQNSVKG